MAKLCYRIGSETKKYDLKDSADTPRIAIKNASTTKYIPLKEAGNSTKSGELAIYINNKKYYIKTWGIDNGDFYRHWQGTIDNGGSGGACIWCFYTEDYAPVLAIGRIASITEEYNGFWCPEYAPVDYKDLNPKANPHYIWPYIRLLTKPFQIAANNESYRPSAYPTTAESIYNHLTNPNYTSTGYSHDILESRNNRTLYYTDPTQANNAVYSKGYEDIDHILTNSEMDLGDSDLPGLLNYQGTPSAFQFKVGWKNVDTGIYDQSSVTTETPLLPYIKMKGWWGSVQGEKYCLLNEMSGGVYKKWGPGEAIRDFYVEWPVVQLIGASPRQVLNAWKKLLEDKGRFTKDYGDIYTCSGVPW